MFTKNIMIRNLQAVNTYILIIRDDAEEKIGELYLPDQAQIKPATGEIISVGGAVTDEKIRVGKKALFNKHVGVDIELGGETVTVLHAGEHDSQVIAII